MNHKQAIATINLSQDVYNHLAGTVSEETICAVLSALLDLQQQQTDLVIEQNGQPQSALIPFADYRVLYREEILEDIRDGREAEAILADIERDPTSVRPYEDVVREYKGL